MDLYHLYKLFLLLEAFEDFALIIRHRYDTFRFGRRICSYCFIISAVSSGFFTSSATSISSSISTAFLIVANCFLIRVSSQVKIKNNHYSKNLKHSLQTKMRLLWAQNMFFSTWLRVVKVLCHRHFGQTVFPIKLMSKRIFERFC